MDSIVTSVIPLFAVILIGFAAARLGAFDQAAVRTLVTFVFTLAMPALLFRLMADADIAGTRDWPVVFAYFTAQLPVFLGGLLIGARLFRQSMAEMTIQAFGSTFSNSVVLGLPLVLGLYGERASVPALLIIMLDVAIFGVITLLLEIAELRDKPGARRRLPTLMRDLALSVGTNPLILAILLGIAFGLSSLTLPAVADKTLAFLGQAAPPAGLFALGATLGLRRMTGRAGPVGAMLAMKLLVHPALTAFSVFWLFDLDPTAAGVALLFAAGPVGANVYVFAANYHAAVETSAAAILLSTAAALVTLSGLVIFLSNYSL